jgi:hypothetical protein
MKNLFPMLHGAPREIWKIIKKIAELRWHVKLKGLLQRMENQHEILLAVNIMNMVCTNIP